MPEMVKMVLEWIRKTLKGKKFAIGIDGGSSKIEHGLKVLPIIALSPEFPFDIVVDIPMMRTHETGVSQAAVVRDWVKREKIDPLQITWMVADDNALNSLSCKILNEEHGFNLQLARCLDHCLNLVFVAFVAPFEKRFKLGSLLRSVRAYLNAGGGQTRKCTLALYAVSQSRIDFTATRWTSFMSAINYLMSKQTPRELKYARKLLEECAEEGDTQAAADLEAEDIPHRHYDVLFWALESMGKDVDEKAKKKTARDPEDPLLRRADGTIFEVQLDKLIASFADIETFAAAYALSTILRDVPALFRVLQGNERFEAALEGLHKDDKKRQGVFNAVAAARGIVNDLKALDDQDSQLRAAVMIDIERECREQIVITMARSKEYDEPLVKDAEGYNVDDERAYMDGAAKEMKKALERIERAIKEASEAIKTCAGIAKLEEALDHLDIKERYNLNAKTLAAPPPINDLSAVYKFFGVPASVEVSLPHARDLIAAWEAHRKSYEPPADGASRSPADVFKYWQRVQARKGSSATLARYAVLARLRPVGNAAPERVMSHVTDIDKPTRRNMMKTTYHDTIFLRANSGIVRLLLQQMAEEIDSAGRSAVFAEEKAAQVERAKQMEAALKRILADTDAEAADGAASAASDDESSMESDDNSSDDDSNNDEDRDEDGEALANFDDLR